MLPEFTEKLVRDRIPEIVGTKPDFRVATGKELWFLLKEKLIEEASELHCENCINGLSNSEIEELADVVEVVEALKHYVEEKSPGSLEQVRAKKAKIKGCFEHGYVMHIKK